VSGFYEAIGRLVLMWGRLEQHVDNLERMAINIEARSATERLMIVSLQRKLDTIKDIYRDCPTLQHNYPAVRQLMHDIGVLGEDRHVVIHSIFSQFQDGPPPKLVVRHITHRKGDMKTVRYEFDLDILLALTSKIYQAHERLMPILIDAVEHQDPEALRKARSRGPQAGGGSAPIPL
jgi:hypothetical protein